MSHDQTRTTELEALRRSQLELVRAAKPLLTRYNFYDMAEDDSRQWQCLADAVTRSGVRT